MPFSTMRWSMRRCSIWQSPAAELIFAGKRRGKILLQAERYLAHAGVARAQGSARAAGSKAAIPFVFGRGAEEALYARPRRRAVPGRAGRDGRHRRSLPWRAFPVTHRDTNHAVNFHHRSRQRTENCRSLIGRP